MSAIAAGCAAVVKPSEMTPQSEKLLCELIPQYLDSRMVRVVKGAAAETTALLKEKWDHIFYTGNGAVGRVVLRAAAEHLTPVTLELGGKSPLYFAEDGNIEVGARRILGTKMLNVGQTCIAPDYLLVHNSVKDKLVSELKANVKKFYGNDVKQADSMARIVNERHFDRVVGLLNDAHGGKVVEGGLATADRKDKFLPPTIVLDPSPTSRLMTEEIFGPVLPIIGVNSMADALKIINQKEHSLASYIYTTDSKKIEEFMCVFLFFSRVRTCVPYSDASHVSKQTHSGGTCVNDCLFHMCVLPAVKMRVLAHACFAAPTRTCPLAAKAPRAWARTTARLALTRLRTSAPRSSTTRGSTRTSATRHTTTRTLCCSRASWSGPSSRPSRRWRSAWWPPPSWAAWRSRRACSVSLFFPVHTAEEQQQQHAVGVILFLCVVALCVKSRGKGRAPRAQRQR